MKKLILLLLLFTSFVNAQTYNDVLDLINTNLANNSKITAVKHREVEIALLNYIQENLLQSGDIKAIKCNLTYLNDNFDVNGLGKNLRAGWAICNGNNGTDNLGGRVIVGYGAGYSTFSAQGGSKDAVIVEHDHLINEVYNENTTGTKVGSGGGGIEAVGTQRTQKTGVSGIDKNMQPYSVQLYIMKLWV